MAHGRSCDTGYADFYHEEYVLKRLERQREREANMAKKNTVRISKALVYLVADEIADKSFLEDEASLKARLGKVSEAIYDFLLPPALAVHVQALDKKWFHYSNAVSITIGDKAAAPPVTVECVWPESRAFPIGAQYGNFQLREFGKNVADLATLEEARSVKDGFKDLEARRLAIREQTVSFLSSFATFNKVFEDWPDLANLLTAGTLKLVEPKEVMALPMLATENFIETLAKAGVPPKVKEAA